MPFSVLPRHTQRALRVDREAGRGLIARTRSPMTDTYPPMTPFGPDFLPAPTGSESAAFDRFSIDAVGVPQRVLMENAGRSTASVVAQLYPHGRVVGLVGSGNNGGDALVCLRTLAAWGRDVVAVLVADRPQDDPLMHGWSVPVMKDSDLNGAEWETTLTQSAVVIDGILGTGVRGAPRERQAEAIAHVERSGVPVVAIDVPSGVDADTGAVPGASIGAAVTVSYGAPKLGSLLHPARARTGRMVAVEIGFPPAGGSGEASPGTGRVVTAAWAHAQRPSRSSDTHKNAVGRVCVVAGSPGMAGAAILAAGAAYRTGAGYVRVCSPEANRSALQAALPEAIFVSSSDVEAVEKAVRESDAVLLGPGLGTDEAARTLADTVVSAGPAALLLDADGLNLAADGAFDLRRVAGACPVLATPHVGEMARLVGTDQADVKADRLGVLKEAVARFGCSILLKGAPSLVGDPDGPVWVDVQATSDLAVAGMGDALAGVCATFLAQGVTVVEAGALGLFHSGRAARIAGRGVALTPSDVIRWLPQALSEQGAARSDLTVAGLLFDTEAAR